MRDIFLPELLSINIKNYTLYPNGLDFTFNFVKGFNLVIGGNGMGKTTFVSLIKYALIGNYKKQFDYTRTYREVEIEKRERHSDDFFKNRIDNSIEVDSPPTVTINFKVRDTIISLTRGLEEVKIESLSINGVQIEGEKILEAKYEILKKRDATSQQLESYLPSIYEKEFAKLSKISFDDLIFFVNYILFFGEDHKTILWDNEVQKELINTFFNSPELNDRRKEAERKAKYFDSRARHKSEDKRAINDVLKRIDNKNKTESVENPVEELIKLKEKIERLNSDTIRTHNKRTANSSKISILESDKNSMSQKLDQIETKRNQLVNTLSFSEYKNQHRLYNSFLKNIQTNHICPICNSLSEELYTKAIKDESKCWVCENDIVNTSEINNESREALKIFNEDFNKTSTSLKSIQNDITLLEVENKELDIRFRDLDSEKRQCQIKLREFEFENNQQESPSELQPFYDEIEKLTREQEEFSLKSEEQKNESNRIAQLIEDTVLNNVQKFSNLFSLYAQKFLGVECILTYEKLGNDILKKFYPKINSIVRKTEFELSESQRFFIDHSFRMSILSHFYTTPTFYIVETPDSSLDLSYEKNAADVFSSFLDKPYSLIITSNLNNSSFVNFIIENKEKEINVVPLFEIAKKSVIQENNDALKQLYKSIKNG